MLLKSMKRLEMTHPIIWLSRPEMGDLIGQFRERLVVYHVVDEYTAYQGVTEELALWLRLQEEHLMAQADMAIVVSPALQEAKQPYNPHTYLVPNGVDFEAFRCALMEGNPPPTDLADIREPRLVYAGLVGARLDLALLKTIAQRHPEWSLVMIGQVDSRGCEEEVSHLHALPNVHFLGIKPPSAVPGYLLSSQVCLLPYGQSDECDHIDPLKLYEALASGKPVVCTPIPAALPYRDLIRLASGAGEFEAAVQESLTDPDDGIVGRRQAVAAANTWETRVEQVSALIQSHLHDK
jgi:glycosyltransferase involved in cell wall biosynthesis